MARFQRFLQILAAWAVFFVVYTALSAGATDFDLPEGVPKPLLSDPARNPIIVYLKGPMEGEFYTPADLIKQLRVSDRLRVIVGLDFDMVAPHQLSEAKVRVQAAKLAALQDQVLSAMPDLSEEVVIRKYHAMPYMVLMVDEAQLRSLLNDSHVVSIQEDGTVVPYLDLSTKVTRVNELWEPPIGLTGAGQTVVIIDSGVHHPTMIDESRIVHGGCFSTPKEAAFCDWKGRWYGCMSSCKPRPKGDAAVGTQFGGYCASGLGFSKKGDINKAKAWSAYCDHGTHVGTTSAGDTGVAGEIKGMAWKADVIRMMVFYLRVDWTHLGWRPYIYDTWRETGRPHDSAGPLAQSSDITAALQMVYDLATMPVWMRDALYPGGASKKHSYKIAAVNMSLGGGAFSSYCDLRYPDYSDIINKLTDIGIAVVIAAGNAGDDPGAKLKVGAPGCIEKAVTVGSTLNGVLEKPCVDCSTTPAFLFPDRISSFSQHNETIDLLAPGGSTGMKVTWGPDWPWGIVAGNAQTEGARVPETIKMQGTSMASPHVAGAITVLKEGYPNATVEELVTALKCTGQPVARWGISRSRIDLRGAYEFLKNGETDCKLPNAVLDPTSLKDAGRWLPRHRWF
jgi:subtilisin family serine protease